MKVRNIILWLVLFYSFSVIANTLSQTNGGPFVAIGDAHGTNVSIPYDNKLVWAVFSDTDSNEFNYPDPLFGIKIRMFDNNGKEVPKTPLGISFGSRFDKVKKYEDVISGWHMGSIFSQKKYDSRTEISGPILPSPKDLFKINAAGTYNLEIQMQMFLIIKNTNAWTRRLIRFSPVTISVVKPSED